MRRDDDTGRTTVDPRDRPMDDMPVLPPAGPDSNVFASDDRENAGGADADRTADARARNGARSEDDAQLTEATRSDDVEQVDRVDETHVAPDHERGEPESRTEDADLLASESRADPDERTVADAESRADSDERTVADSNEKTVPVVDEHERADETRADRASQVDEFQPVDDERPSPDEAMVDSTATAADVSVIDRPSDQDRTAVDEPVELAADATGQAMAPGDVEAEPVRDLWPENAIAGLRDRWRDIQLRFVDDPASAARDADSLVGEAIDNLTMSLGAQRTELARWQQSDSTDDTEQLRVAVQRYRGFLDKLLDL